MYSLKKKDLLTCIGKLYKKSDFVFLFRNKNEVLSRDIDTKHFTVLVLNNGGGKKVSGKHRRLLSVVQETKNLVKRSYN